ncbi:hypothetical protein B0A52_04224 [Exophiala mesophila]|uniref:Protein kinase domain-containing protein n=1 Tax=Exophiala mesophila TaxID=212818 RepID=A0A438N7T6_EXOME|nr:hypothetical protein B0A52_04224 [Exophiala mesophila]
MGIHGGDNDLIDFDILETHKENIQQLPGGRSAKQLASVLSPLSLVNPGSKTTPAAPTLDETKTLNDAIRQEYEVELQSIADSDDPLDIYDRYVKWTLNAYPSAQATPQSQLLPLLERATKAFLTSSHYKNDPRYLKLWLHYIRLFSDSPRETFAFLARHNIGDGLGLFYEEFATWLEAAERWSQADEVYQLGIQREARPAERLMRKYTQFQQRYNARPQNGNGPSSPALPTVRAALAAKHDPFAPATHEEPSQQQRQQANSTGATSRSGKPKMAIFSDTDSAPPPALSGSDMGASKGWDSIESMKERKKENTMEPRAWAGETLKGGKKVGTAPKMEIFKDPSGNSRQPSDIVNPRTGRTERVFVNMDSVYPPGGKVEYSFEELRAQHRGWMSRDWRKTKDEAPCSNILTERVGNLKLDQLARNSESQQAKSTEAEDVENLSHSFQQAVDLNATNNTLCINDTSTQSMVGMPESQSSTEGAKQKRVKVREVKQEPQTVKTRLESPTGKKLKRKNSGHAEPTMTFHSKAATNEIYDMFNQPLRKPAVERDDTQSGDDGDFTEGDIEDGYSTTGDGESTGTGHISGTGSEFGEDTSSGLNSQSQPESVSPWSDFTASKHVPPVDLKSSGKAAAATAKKSTRKTPSRRRRQMSEDLTETVDSMGHTQSDMDGFDTQAIANIANADFGDMDTKAIAMIAGDFGDSSEEEADEDKEEDEDDDEYEEEDQTQCSGPSSPANVRDNNQDHKDATADLPNDGPLTTPVDEPFPGHWEVQNAPRFVPIPSEDYEPTPVRPFRDSGIPAHKLPFMTPIVERTESSLAPSTVFQDPEYFASKTPSRRSQAKYDSPSKLNVEDLLLSSPQREEGTPSSSAKRKLRETDALEVEILTSSPQKKPFGRVKCSPAKPGIGLPGFDSDLSSSRRLNGVAASPAKPIPQPAQIHKGPVILDLQCNPCDDAVRQQILTTVHPPIASYAGFKDNSAQSYGQYATLKGFAEKSTKAKGKSSPRKSVSDKAATKAVPPILKFAGTDRVYAVKRQLGEGAFAPVYLVDSYDPSDAADPDQDKENGGSSAPRSTPERSALEALKSEAPPGTLAWEFHILRTIRQRLGRASRTMQSIVLAHECHLYRDEAYLVLSYSPQGTLLDLVNLARSENIKAGKLAEGLDETLAMFFSIELLKVLEDIHRIGILHGDLKGDNCLVRLDTSVDVTRCFDPEGANGWSSKGLTLIDFGRGIDTRMFKPQAQFIADWASSAQDCAEIRECRPWKYQIDYHGAAGVIHSLLFGKYIETVPAAGGGLGQKKEWKLKDNLKRYWEKDVWSDCFAMLLNPGSVEDGEEMPIQGNLKRVRVRMEQWLRDEGERGGRDLRGSLRRMERLVAAK